MCVALSVRDVYKSGIVKEENKFYEVKCLCDCYQCKNRYAPRTRRNAAYAYVYNEKAIEKAKKFLRNWNCGNSKKDLPEQFFHIDCDGNFT